MRKSAVQLKLAALAAWIRVLVKRGLEIVKRPKIVGCNWESSFRKQLVNAHRTLLRSYVGDSDHVTIIVTFWCIWPEQHN